MHIGRLIVVALVALCAGASLAAAQEARGGAEELTAEESRLVAGSRAAIIAAGLSPAFFDAHFRLEKVFARPADRRVVWRLKVAEYETTVNDSVGSYTDEKGARRDAHSITGRLAPARDIVRTIPRRRAEQLMKACIGAYQDEGVVYEPFGSPPRAALVFTAVSLPEPPKTAKSATQTSTNASTQNAAPLESDPIRQGGKKKPPPRIGMINLETGRCVVGVGQSGSPHPDAERYARPRD